MSTHRSTAIFGAACVLALNSVAAFDLTSLEQLGKDIFFDEDLSFNRNQSCATCHGPAYGWTGPLEETNLHGAVYEGSIPGEELW